MIILKLVLPLKNNFNKLDDGFAMGAPLSNIRPDYKMLVSCAGLGMGNASRLSAIMEALYQKSHKDGFSVSIKILSWGPGFLFLEKFKENSGLPFELVRLQPYGGKLGLSEFVRHYLSNCKALKHAIRSTHPDLLLLDSDYHFSAYLFSSLPKIYIGQAFDVLERAKSRSYRANNFFEKINFFIREKLDSKYQQFVSTKVLVPSFLVTNHRSSKFQKIPLIVREEFLKTIPKKPSVENSVAILLSGSEIDKEDFLRLKDKYHLHIISPSKLNGVQLSHAETLDQYDIILTQGGLTSISEVIARKKFLIVFPIKNHPEQILNAIEVEKLGIGLKAETQELAHFPTLLKRIQEVKRQNIHYSTNCNGADQCADTIISYLIKLSADKSSD